MDSHDAKFEKLNISIAVCHSFEELDFVVCTFKPTGRYGMVIPIQDAKFEHRHRPGHFA